MRDNYTFHVYELPAGLRVAAGESDNYVTTLREAMHYAGQYAQDGDVRVDIKHGRRLIARIPLQSDKGIEA